MRSLLIAIALCFASVVNAADKVGFYKDGAYLHVESQNNPAAFSRVVAVLEKAGWPRKSEDELVILALQSTRATTFCDVKVFKYAILVECYAPTPGHSVTVRDALGTQEIDYVKLSPMLVQLRDEHRRVSTFLGIE